MSKLEDDILYREIFMSNKSSGGGGITPTEPLYDISDSLVMKTITDYSNDSLYKVGDYAFYNCTKLKSFKCPEVSEIGAYAFSDCGNLADFDFSSVETIGNNAFMNCSAFISCTLNVAKTIDFFAFRFCDYLKNISLPELSEIGSGVFHGCDNLEYIKIGSQDSTEVATAYLGNPISYAESYTCPKIYVADSLIDEYRNATTWNIISDNIYPLSTFTE